jgi:RecJ-like exonuclease
MNAECSSRWPQYGHVSSIVVAHLERRFACGTLAAEVAVLVGRDRDRHLEAVLGVADVADALGLGQVLQVAHEVQSSTRP